MAYSLSESDPESDESDKGNSINTLIIDELESKNVDEVALKGISKA